MDSKLTPVFSEALEEFQALGLGYEYLGSEWEREFQRAILTQHARAYYAGQGYNGLSPAADRELGEIFTRQLQYFKGFAAAAPNLTMEQRAYRAGLYAGALKETFSRGQYQVWSLPYHPAEGTECMTACKCSWELQVIDLEELDANAYWRLGDAEHCPTCSARAASNPHRIRGGTLQ